MDLLSAAPLACAGHLLIDLPLFFGPVVVLVGWLWLTTRRGREREPATNHTPAHALDSKNGEKPVGVQA